MNPSTLSIVNVPLSGFDYEELTSLTYLNGGFFASDLGNSASDMPRWLRITPGGAVTSLGDMDHVAKGLALPSPPLPPVPSVSSPLLALLIAMLGSSGATRLGRRRILAPAR